MNICSSSQEIYSMILEGHWHAYKNKRWRRKGAFLNLISPCIRPVVLYKHFLKIYYF